MSTPFHILEKVENILFKDVPLYTFFRFKDSSEILIKVSCEHRVLHNNNMVIPRCLGVPSGVYALDAQNYLLILKPNEWIVYALDDKDQDGVSINWENVPVIIIPNDDIKIITVGDYK